MEKTTYTKRNVYEALINLATDGKLVYGEEAIELTSEDLIAFAENEIALLDKKASKAKERAATKRAEGDELTEAVYATMSKDEPETIADITARIEGEDVSVHKVAYRLRVLAETGRAEKSEIVIPATETSKKRTVVAYKAL